MSIPIPPPPNKADEPKWRDLERSRPGNYRPFQLAKYQGKGRYEFSEPMDGASEETFSLHDFWRPA